MPDLDAAFRRAQNEILEDMIEGRVPENVGTFPELHEHVDANEYGGLCEFDLPHDELADFGNALQDRLDVWMRSGHRRPSRTIR
jgi:hypothetical protein